MSDTPALGYTDAIVTFIDILGFSSLVEDSAEAQDVHDLLDLFVGKSVETDEYKSFLGMQVISVSDTVIRSVDLDATSDQPLLQNEIAALMNIQVEMILEGRCIRGGISTGDVCMSPQRFFGPAYQRAYFLESSVARVPRIVLDRNLVAALCQDEIKYSGADFGQGLLEVANLTKRDSDGEYFIDYLGSFASEADSSHAYFDFVEHHREFVCEFQSMQSHENSLGSKARWLRRYHNQTVDRLFDAECEACGVSKDSLRVPSPLP